MHARSSSCCDRSGSFPPRLITPSSSIQPSKVMKAGDPADVTLGMSNKATPLPEWLAGWLAGWLESALAPDASLCHPHNPHSALGKVFEQPQIRIQVLFLGFRLPGARGRRGCGSDPCSLTPVWVWFGLNPRSRDWDPGLGLCRFARLQMCAVGVPQLHPGLVLVGRLLARARNLG